MRRILQKIFRPFFIWLADKAASAPDRESVFTSLTKLLKKIRSKDSSRGISINIDVDNDRFIIFSDQHKGAKNRADDFFNNEPNYIAALNYYRQQNFTYINIGDCEELWENKPTAVIEKNKQSLQAEAQFQTNNKYYRTFGNHDLLWKNSLDVSLLLKDVFTMPLPVYEGIILKTTINREPLTIFLTHGHQGDKMSDNNAFSTWIVAHIWVPIQNYLDINVNTPADTWYLRDKHNILMYEWSKTKKNVILVTGHTHKPVFASGKYAVKEEHKIETNIPEHKIDPSYFNTGCCCYNDGDITGIEIAEGSIRLIKWRTDKGISQRSILEEKKLADILNDMK